MSIIVFISVWMLIGAIIGVGLGAGGLMIFLDANYFKHGIKPQGPRLIIWAIVLVVFSLVLANTACSGQIARFASDNETHPAICR